MLIVQYAILEKFAAKMAPERSEFPRRFGDDTGVCTPWMYLLTMRMIYGPVHTGKFPHVRLVEKLARQLSNK